MRTCYLLIVFLIHSIAGYAQRFDAIPDFAREAELENTTGVSVADYDQDGDLDVYLVSAEVFDAENPFTWSRLLRNDGAGGFKDVTEDSHLINREAAGRDGSQGSKMGASWGDYDNDGYPDIFLSNRSFDELWYNNGDGTFSNVTEETDLAGCNNCYTTTALWWDYDRDGDLDLYLADWLRENRFYRNDGANQFVDVSAGSGLDDEGHTWSSLPIDLDRDGWIDLYVINDVGPNRFYRNLGDGTFQEMTRKVGLEDSGDGMGVDVGDYNNDGHFDIYITNIHHFHPNPFFINAGNGAFVDRALSLGVEDTGWGWGVRFFDVDHDLDEDMYVVNGFFDDIAKGDRNIFYEQINGRYSNVASNAGIDNDAISMGLEVFDYDQDGDIDMLVGNRNAPVSLYKSRTMEIGGDANWLQVRLEGTKNNKNAFGSTVKITCDGVDYYRYHSGVNLLGQSIKPIHFGLGDHNLVQKLEVTWPDGTMEETNLIEANQVITLKEGTLKLKVVTSVPLNETVLRAFPNPFKDYFEVSVPADDGEQLYMQLWNATGRMVKEHATVVRDGRIRMALRDSEQAIPAGLYFFQAEWNGNRIAGRVFKQ